MLKYAARIAARAGVSAATVLDPHAPVAATILERAREHDLLVIGAPKTSWLARLIAGGVAKVALRQFTTPMLLVRPSISRPLREGQIVVASDGWAGSKALVRLAGEIAAREHAHVTLVHALGAESDARTHEISAQGRALEQALPGRVSLRIEPGRAAEAISSTARAVDASLVLVGSRRLRGVRTLGSVSRSVLVDSPCSVLVLPPPAETAGP